VSEHGGGKPHRGSRGIPSTVALPDRAPARGQPSMQPAAGLVQLCPRDGGVVALGEVVGVSRSGHPRGLPARRGHPLVLRLDPRLAKLLMNTQLGLRGLAVPQVSAHSRVLNPTGIPQTRLLRLGY